MWNIILYYTPQFSINKLLFYFIVILCCVIPAIKSAGCGGFIEPASGTTGTFQSKNYGTGSYDPYTNCIWILEAPSEYQVQVTIDFEGETFEGACADFIEIKDGTASSNSILDEFCGTYSGHVVTSTARWMYFRFKTDAINATSGLNVRYTAVFAGAVISNVSTPLQDCRTHEFECSNKRCMARAYLCDGFNDCGCDGNCDEDDCDGLGIEKFTRIGFSAGIGAGMFLILCILIYFTDRYSKRKELLRQQMEEEKEKRGKRGKKDDKKAAAKRRTTQVKKVQVEPTPPPKTASSSNNVFWHS